MRKVSRKCERTSADSLGNVKVPSRAMQPKSPYDSTSPDYQQAPGGDRPRLATLDGR